jgi:putative (di)nucleoside polyphosphate hydrolase
LSEVKLNRIIGVQVIDSSGFRLGVGIIVVNAEQQVLWAKRVGQDAWQFPQGGMDEGESPEEAMYRELFEELGLQKDDVSILAVTRRWLYYRLPKRYLRHYSKPLCIGQKQRWFLLQLEGAESRIKFDAADTPEFDDWLWVSYWHPMKHVVSFKRKVYHFALKEFASKVLNKKEG